MAANDRNLPLSLTFRGTLLRRVTETLRAGESCSIVGTGGVGKTNLARFLLRQDVQEHYWGSEPVWVLLIDSNAIAVSGRSSEFTVLELIIHRLICETERRELPAEFVAELDRLHSTLIAQPDTLLALRYLERIIGRLCREPNLQLVLVFDQFEEIWQTLDPHLFLNLRYLRDEFKYRLVYLTITRERLSVARRRTRGDEATVETFWEMFEPHVFGLGMYEIADAHEMLDRIERRQGRTLGTALRQAAMATSGGHSALLRAITWGMARDSALIDDIDALSALPAVTTECAKLWADLLPEEQFVVQQLAHGLQPPKDQQEALSELRLKEIVQSNALELFSPIFAAYVRCRAGPHAANGVVVDVRQRLVLVDGRMLDSSLSPLEFGLLEHLARYAGQVCKRDDILAVLYPNESQEASDERIDTLLRRLRDALGEDGRNPRHLFTHRGVGLRLAHGSIRD
ncbi:MAG: hypothetical protein HGA19_04125 [Oscillochloris sp.]|nr:hypothetical protein [Oscillochloris sp.]